MIKKLIFLKKRRFYRHSGKTYIIHSTKEAKVTLLNKPHTVINQKIKRY